MTKREVLVIRESLFMSIVSDLVTFAFLLLCIYVSRESTWWTFATGSMFILFIAARASISQKTVIKNKDEAIAWAGSFDEGR